MIHHRRPDGILELRSSFYEFAQRWRVTADESKLVLDDPGALKRPAIWISKDDKTVMAPHPAHWEQWRRTQKRGGVNPTSRERTCRQCGHILKLSKELSDVWTFWCEVCRSIDIQGKELVGGTMGAGENEPRS